MSTKLTLEQMLDITTPCATAAESARMLSYIESTITPVIVTPSPYSIHYYFSFRPVSYFALMLVILLGATSTVAASGSAKPGDLLFPIDRATEEIRLALATPDQKELLQHTFIIERFAELREIVAEEKIATTTSTSSDGITVRAAGESRVAHAIAILATQLLSETNATSRDQFARDLMTEVSGLRVEGRTNSPLRLDDSRVLIDESRTEVRTVHEQVKIEKKDGRVIIHYEDRPSVGVYDDSDDRAWLQRDSRPATSTERRPDGHDRKESLRHLDTTNVTLSAEEHNSRERKDSSRDNESKDDRHSDSGERKNNGGN